MCAWLTECLFLAVGAVAALAIHLRRVNRFAHSTCYCAGSDDGDLAWVAALLGLACGVTGIVCGIALFAACREQLRESNMRTDGRAAEDQGATRGTVGAPRAHPAHRSERHHHRKRDDELEAPPLPARGGVGPIDRNAEQHAAS